MMGARVLIVVLVLTSGLALPALARAPFVMVGEDIRCGMPRHEGKQATDCGRKHACKIGHADTAITKGVSCRLGRTVKNS